MQTKYLFGMLLSGAMLAACTAEDDFNSAKVAQEANPSAPVFTVKFDGQDLQNRATQNEGTGWRLGFDNGDLLSLYHGVSANDNENYAEFTGWQNAIYVGGQTASEGAMTFTTKSMVNPGGAILIWPADTTFQNSNDAAPILRIPAEQDAETKNMIPYMSEVITIEDFVQVPDRDKNYDQDVTAGYNRQYDITLKRVGSNLNLILNNKNTDKINAAIATAKTSGVKAADLDIKRVVLKNEKAGSTGVFTTAIPVKALEESSVARKEIPFTNPTQYTHPTWKNQSSVADDDDSIEQSDSLATTDIKDGKAVFTLLPSKKTSGSVTELANTEAQIWVYTNYGKVVLKDKNTTTKNEILKNRAGDTKYGVAEALNGILSDNTLWWPTTTESNPFYAPNNGEKMGAYATRQLDIDMSALDMNDLHIKDEDHLRSAIAVYEALKLDMENHVNFILDGDENGKFVMHKETWEAVMAELATNGKADNKYYDLTFSPCVIGDEACTAIQLVNDGEAEEVPALQFELVKQLTPATGNVALALELVGNWKYTGHSNGESRDFAGLQTINVLKGATLALDDYIAVASYDEDSNAAGVKSLEVKAGGFVTVDGNTYVQLPVNNLGTITVGTRGFLRAHNGGTIINKQINVDVDKNAIAGLDNGKLTYENGTYKSGGSGLIVNYGYIGSAPGTTGVINNYGVVKNASKDAKVLLTANGMTTNTASTGVAVDYNKSTNAIGSVYLFDKTSTSINVSVNKGGVQGFIKQTVDEDEPKYADFSEVANWITVTGACKTIKYEVEDGEELYLPSRVDYIELQPNAGGSELQVTVKGTLKNETDHDARLSALIVPENCTLYIPQTSMVTMRDAYAKKSAIYTKGLIMFGNGALVYSNRVAFKSYFGGDADDENTHMIETN